MWRMDIFPLIFQNDMVSYDIFYDKTQHAPFSCIQEASRCTDYRFSALGIDSIDYRSPAL